MKAQVEVYLHWYKPSYQTEPVLQVHNCNMQAMNCVGISEDYLFIHKQNVNVEITKYSPAAHVGHRIALLRKKQAEYVKQADEVEQEIRQLAALEYKGD